MSTKMNIHATKKGSFINWHMAQGHLICTISNYGFWSQTLNSCLHVQFFFVTIQEINCESIVTIPYSLQKIQQNNLKKNLKTLFFPKL